MMMVLECVVASVLTWVYLMSLGNAVIYISLLIVYSSVNIIILFSKFMALLLHVQFVLLDHLLN